MVYSTLGALILMIPYLVLFISVFIASPTLPIFALPIRIKRMICDYIDNDIFF